MKTRAALLFSKLGKWETVEADLDEPKTGEVLVQMVASGLCHSDDHIVTGDFPPRHLPVCGGHEGSGIVQAVGPGVTDLEVGDHVVTSFIPACGQCRWCAAGQQHLCDTGRQWGSGAMLDGTYRMHVDGRDVSLNSLVGTFSEWQVVNQRSLVKVSKDFPLDVICLVSCGVPTGWGSATTAASIEPGDVIVVMGCGGVGMNAVQGAAHKGASHVVAVDIEPLKRETALRLGATHAYDNMTEALEFIWSVTNGQGADVAIACTGVLTGEHIGECFRAVRKAATDPSAGAGDQRGPTCEGRCHLRPAVGCATPAVGLPTGVQTASTITASLIARLLARSVPRVGVRKQMPSPTRP
jgi:S-(hydroxymethyl)glutathione dehydrogenase/alcohol dehydrogenase